jgi:flagellar biosynthesis protein
MTEKRKKAIALRYDQKKDAAPVILAKGVGILAEKILALAREHKIPIHQDEDLVEILSGLKLHQEIPPEAYLLVAEILAFVYRSNDKYPLPK